MKDVTIAGLCITMFLIAVFSVALHAQPGVQIWAEPLEIPTYTVDQPDPNPRFYAGRGYQGAQGRIYPYPISDVLTNQQENKQYIAVYLENPYLKLCVLPEIGGRIFSAVDKTNNYDFFYRQHVIKPALIGMLGAWISGGVEWNFPHHHRARTFMPMDYTIVENPDGSKTLWMGELEIRHRMRFLLGMTLYPDKSYLEVAVKIQNPTPFVHSFLYWANPAVHVDDTYQVIFSPQTQYVTQHAKNEFSEWPVSRSRYGGWKYNQVDISWWKNLPKPVSFFCWYEEADFFAGYNHGKNAGVAYVADHHVSPGKKFFTFGCGDEGKMWDKMLTDNDGPYLELMAGAYSDNQPDYSWIQPYEVKTVNQYWYPIRDIEGLKYANTHAALNLELASDGSAKIRVNATSILDNAEVTLRTGQTVLYQTQAAIRPDLPFKAEAKLPEGTHEQDLVLTVSSGKTILAQYQPSSPEKSQPRPQPVVPPAAPQEIKTIEELYLTGLRLDQFYNTKLDPYTYYQEALRRDPNDSRVNTQLGILYSKRGLFNKAQQHLEAALGRITANYTRPKTTEAYYYLGVALCGQGHYQHAYDAFSRAAWDAAWHSASHYALAELDCRSGNLLAALDHLEQSLATNSRNTKIRNLKTTVLRKLNRDTLARENALDTLQIDPLDVWTQNELHLLESSQTAKAKPFVPCDIQSSLELAVDYGNCGFYEDAIQYLTDLKDKADNPMVYYTLGYYNLLKGSAEQARSYFSTAAKVSPVYGFPFRPESIDALEAAIKHNPKDGRAHYYLGNLWYDNEPEYAITHWEKACALDQTNPNAFRNLGFAFWQVKQDATKAIASMEKALSLSPDDARLYYELDLLYEAARVPAQTRLAWMEKNSTTVSKRDDALARKAILYLQTANYEKAFTLLTTHHFNTWEGGGEIHDYYVDACLLYGRQKYLKNELPEALKLYQAALDYPDNLEVGRPLQDETAVKTLVWLGDLYERMNPSQAAQDCYRKAISIEVDADQYLYDQAIAFRKLGQQDKAQELFSRLIKEADRFLARDSQDEFFAKFGEKQSQNKRIAAAHYLKGLGYQGRNEYSLAKQEFEKVIALDPYHIWAAVHLEELNTHAPQSRTWPSCPQPTIQRAIPAPLPGHPGNIYLNNEEVTIPLPAGLSKAAIRWQVLDDAGRTINSGAIDKSLSVFSLGKPGIGWYKIEFLDSNRKVLDYTTAAVLARLAWPTPQDSPVCIDAAMSWLAKKDPRNQEHLSNLAALAGINWIRDRIRWSEIHLEKETFDRNSQYHTAADIQNRSGLKVLQVYHDTPQWAKANENNNNRFPQDLRIVYQACNQFGVQFGKWVQAWEPWNEANASNFGGHTMAEMCSFQKAAYLGFKATNPDLIVGWNPYAGSSSAHHTAGVLENQAWPYFDTYNIHSYDWPESYRDIFAPAREAACGKPIWLTECDRGTISIGNTPGFDLSPENDLLKAQYMAQSFASGLYAGVDMHFHFILGHYTEGPDNQRKVQFGLLRNDLTPRPSYVAQAAIGRLLAGAKCLGRFSLPDQPDCHIYAFRASPDGQQRDIMVAWAEKPGDWSTRGQFSIPWPLPALRIITIYDYLGRPLGNTPPDKLRSAPIFVVLPVGQTAQLTLDKPQRADYRAGKASPIVLQIAMTHAIKMVQDPKTPWIMEPQYKISPGKETSFEFFAYNFSADTVEGEIVLSKLPAGWTCLPDRWSMRLEPMERKPFIAALSAVGTPADANVSNWIGLQGKFSNADSTALAFSVIVE